MIGDDEIVEQVASLLDSGHKLVSQESTGDLGALAHDGRPNRQLKVVLGKGNGDVVPVVAQLLHLVLVDHGPDESVIGALGILATQFRGTGEARDDLILLAVEGVNDSLSRVLRDTGALKNETENGLEGGHKGVEALLEGQLHIHESHILTTSGIGGVLKEALLLDQLLGSQLLGVLVLEADAGEFARQDGRVCAGPCPRLGAVQLGADIVQSEDDGNDGYDKALGLELAKAVALMDVIPFRVGESSGSSISGGTSTSSGIEGNRGW